MQSVDFFRHVLHIGRVWSTDCIFLFHAVESVRKNIRKRLHTFVLCFLFRKESSEFFVMSNIFDAFGKTQKSSTIFYGFFLIAIALFSSCGSKVPFEQEEEEVGKPVPNEYVLELSVNAGDPDFLTLTVLSASGDMDLEIAVSGEVSIIYEDLYRGAMTKTKKVDFKGDGIKRSRLHAVEGASADICEIPTIGTWEYETVDPSSFTGLITLQTSFYRTRDQLGHDLLTADLDKALSLQDPVDCQAKYGIKSVINLPFLIAGDFIPFVVTVNGNVIK